MASKTYRSLYEIETPVPFGIGVSISIGENVCLWWQDCWDRNWQAEDREDRLPAKDFPGSSSLLAEQKGL